MLISSTTPVRILYALYGPTFGWEFAVNHEPGWFNPFSLLEQVKQSTERMQIDGTTFHPTFWLCLIISRIDEKSTPNVGWWDFVGRSLLDVVLKRLNNF